MIIGISGSREGNGRGYTSTLRKLLGIIIGRRIMISVGFELKFLDQPGVPIIGIFTNSPLLISSSQNP
jgi:hypothetical protein